MSCNQPSHPDTPAEYLNNTQVSAADYTRDSLYLAETFYGYIREDYGGGYVIPGILLFDENTRVYVDTIVYSPDLLKMMGLLLIQSTADSLTIGDPWNGEDKEHFFDGLGMVGYRLKQNQLWEMYPYRYYTVSIGSSPVNVSRMLRSYFFQYMYKYTMLNISGEGKAIGYNLNDIRFWEGPFWQKDWVMQDLYPFQVHVQKYPLSPADVLYSDSLLRLYGVGK